MSGVWQRGWRAPYQPMAVVRSVSLSTRGRRATHCDRGLDATPLRLLRRQSVHRRGPLQARLSAPEARGVGRPEAGPSTEVARYAAPYCRSGWRRVSCLKLIDRMRPASAVTITLPVNRCGACGMSLTPSDADSTGTFPIITPDVFLMLRVQICHRCLDRAARQGSLGIRQLALTVCESIATRHRVRPYISAGFQCAADRDEALLRCNTALTELASVLPSSHARD